MAAPAVGSVGLSVLYERRSAMQRARETLSSGDEASDPVSGGSASEQSSEDRSLELQQHYLKEGLFRRSLEYISTLT